MSEKNEPCTKTSHVWPDDGDTCKCGAMTHADVQREMKRELTIVEKLERMEKDRLVRGLLSVEDVQELQRNRVVATSEPRLTDSEYAMLSERASDAMGLAAEMDSLGFPQVAPGECYMSRRLRHGVMQLGNVDDLHALMDSLGARPGPLKERITELVTRTKEMRAKSEEQCTRAQQERERLARCPGRVNGGARSMLWEQLFMFYLPRCYDVAVEAPTEPARLQARVVAAVRMANDAFTIAWENRA
jgi:hypothetical protein